MSDLALPPRLLWHLVVSQGPAVRGRVFLNDLPVYEDPPTPNYQSTTSQVNNFLVPGKNALRVEVDQMGDISSNMFWAEIFRDADPSAKPVKFHELKWPDAMKELPEPPIAPVPFGWENHFLVAEDHPPPAYADAKAEQFPKEGTDELRAAVKEFRDALADRDASKLTELTWFEAEDSARYFPDRPAPSKATIRSTYASSFEEPWDVPKWDPEQLVFTHRAEGRLVHVTGVDGRHAVRGNNSVRPEAEFLLNPLLVRHRGRWQLYR